MNDYSLSYEGRTSLSLFIPNHEKQSPPQLKENLKSNLKTVSRNENQVEIIQTDSSDYWRRHNMHSHDARAQTQSVVQEAEQSCHNMYQSKPGAVIRERETSSVSTFKNRTCG